MRPGLPQPVHTDSDGEEKQRAGGRERNCRGNEYLTVTHGVKERNVSLADLLVFFIPPLSPSLSPLPPPPLTCAPCRLKYASIIVWEIGSRGLWRKVRLGWACYAALSPCWRPVKEIYTVSKTMKVNWNYRFETIIPWRKKYAGEKLSD